MQRMMESLLQVHICRNFNADKTTQSKIQILMMNRRKASSQFAKEEKKYKKSKMF